jgi:hypothetical protein
MNKINDISNSSFKNKLKKTKNNQIFKYFIDINIIKNLFSTIIDLNIKKNKNNSEKLIIDKTIYKKLKYENKLDIFINNIKCYYNKNKLFYVNRPINYKNFLTIIRQICKLYDLIFENKIKYFNSTYEIYYIINILPIINAYI